jgi:hypothetical protein
MAKSKTSEHITESEMSPRALQSLFDRALFNSSIDDDDDVLVETEAISVYVSINKDNRLLKYTAAYKVDETAPVESKHALVNKMNDDVIFCRFTIPEHHEDTLIADYFLPFGKSISSFNIVSALRLFALVVPNAIRDCDDNDLVK